MPGTRSRSRSERTRRTTSAMRTSMGQAFSHLPHMVQIQGQRDCTSSRSSPMAAMRTTLRGSKPSTPETGQEQAQMPQVMQTSCENGHWLMSLRRRTVLSAGGGIEGSLFRFEWFWPPGAGRSG